jgi:uncharacterized protein with HEPN domain
LTERLVQPAVHAIREAIEGIDGAVRGKTLDDFRANWLLRHGVQRGIEIISEAARRIPPELQARQPNIPWAQIMGIGNVLRHEYHRVSDALICNVVQDYLPPLKGAIAAIEAELKNNYDCRRADAARRSRADATGSGV